MAVAAIKSKSATKFIADCKNKIQKGQVVRKDAGDYLKSISKNETKQPRVFVQLEDGIVHFAVGPDYAGNCKPYQYTITEWWCRAVGSCVPVGDYYFPVKEYVEWVKENTNHTSISEETVSEYLELKDLDFKRQEKPETMRSKLKTETTRMLFEEMVKALYAANEDAAIDFAGRGADIDGQFGVRKIKDIPELFFTGIKEGLAEDRSIEFDAALFTSLLYAADKSYSSFIDFSQQLGANTNAVGQKVHFKKVCVEQDTKTEPSEEMVQVGSTTIPQVILKTKATLMITDSQRTVADITFNPKTNGLTVKPSTAKPPEPEVYYKKIERKTRLPANFSAS